jgi:hypothetical protein
LHAGAYRAPGDVVAFEQPAGIAPHVGGVDSLVPGDDLGESDDYLARDGGAGRVAVNGSCDRLMTRRGFFYEMQRMQH